MTALQSILCGEIQKNVEHREKEFKTYEDLRGVVMRWAINRETENERAGLDPMDCNLAGGDRQEDWLNAEWPTAEESEQPTTDLNFVEKGNGDAKGTGKCTGMLFGGEGEMSPMQMMMAAINATKGGGKGFNNNSHYNNNKEGIKGGKGGEDPGKGCYNCGGSHPARDCPHPKKETRECYKYGNTGHLAKDCRVAITGVDDYDEE